MRINKNLKRDCFFRCVEQILAQLSEISEWRCWMVLDATPALERPKSREEEEAQRKRVVE